MSDETTVPTAEPPVSDTVVMLTIPADMMSGIREVQDENKSLTDCLLDLIWISVLRLRNKMSGNHQ